MSNFLARKEPVTFQFQGRQCVLQIGWCREVQLLSAVILDKETREELALVAANLDDVCARRDELVIRDDGPNGVLQALCDARIVAPTVEGYDYGFVKYQKCQLLVPLPMFIRDGALLERPVVREPSRHVEREI